MKSRMGNKLYCCPPPPFFNFFFYKHEVWNKQEIFLKLNHLSSAQHRHSKSQTYVLLQLKFQQTIDLLLDAEHRNDIPTHNEQVKKNRVILGRFIVAVCYLANQEFPFRGHNESHTSLIKGKFMEFLSLLKNRGAPLESHLNSATVI